MDPDVVGHYELGLELERLAGRSGRIELERTKDLLGRLLPAPPARVLDVGGGPGVYAEWLASRGYEVHLVDPVALHLEQAAARSAASERSFEVEVGDARSLPVEDGSVDAVLLLGPLYHLVDRADRVLALSEARRVLRSDGTVAAAAVSRFASLLDGMKDGYLADPGFRGIVDEDLATGRHRNPTGRPEYFTTAYLHHPDELPGELEDAGLEPRGVYAIEGPGWLLWERWDDADSRAAILRVAAAVEREPTLLGASAHLLAVGRRRS